jgi:hypothetical protein
MVACPEVEPRRDHFAPNTERRLPILSLDGDPSEVGLSATTESEAARANCYRYCLISLLAGWRLLSLDLVTQRVGDIPSG